MTTTNRSRLLLPLLTVLFSTVAFAQTTITWSFWGDPGELPPNDEVISAFEAAHPDIKVQTQHSPYSSYFDRLQTQMAGGTAPDVMFINNVPSYAAKGVLEPLDSYVKKSGFALADYYPDLRKIFSYNGKTYGFARDNDTTVLYYNKDLFDAAGQAYPDDTWDWAKLKEVAAALTTKDGRGRTVQYGLGLEKNKYPLWVYQNGGSVFDDAINATKFTMDEPAGIQAISFVADLILNDGSVPSFDAMQQLGDTTQLFSTGRVAMVMTNAARIPTFEETPFNWDVAPLPMGPTGMRANTAGGAGYAMSSTSAHKEVAWTFLQFLAGPEGQAIFAKTGLAVPALNTPAANQAFLSALPETVSGQVFIDETANGVLFPVFPGWTEIESTIVVPGLDLVWNGEQTAEQAITAMAKPVAAALASQ